MSRVTSRTDSSVGRQARCVCLLGAGLIALLLAVVAGCQQATTEAGASAAPSEAGTRAASTAVDDDADRQAAGDAAAGARLPRLLDLGATKCIPCKMMAPILDELREKLAGRLDVEFIDVWENRQAAAKYGIEQIPTQIFYDASGRELFRHTGFLSKEDILNKWKEFGLDFSEFVGDSEP